MKEEISPEVKKLALYRLEAEISPTFKLSIDNHGIFTKEDLKEHVEKVDKIGRIYIDMQLRFIRDLAKGRITEELCR